MVVAVLAVLLLGGLAGLLARSGPGGGLVIETAPGPAGSETTPATADASGETRPPGVPPISIGQWRALPAAPVEVPVAHAGAWTGEELIAFGGYGDVAAFDPDAGAWRTVGTPPRGVRGIPAPLWAGDELLVWSRDGDVGLRLGAGLAYRPDRDEWRSVAPPPGAPVGAAAAVWTGQEVVAVGPGGALAYDPAQDAWRRLAPPRRAAVARAAAVWTGTEVLVWGGRNQDDGGRGDELPAFAEAYDPRRDTWRRLPRPLLSDSATAAAVWTGEELLMWGSPVAGAGEEAPPTGAALDPGAGAWRLLPPAPGMREPGAADRVYGLSAVWTGEQAVFHGGYPRSVGLAFDPSRGRWATLPRRPGIVNHVAAWTGESLLVWGGYVRRGPTVGLVEWRPVGVARPPF